MCTSATATVCGWKQPLLPHVDLNFKAVTIENGPILWFIYIFVVILKTVCFQIKICLSRCGKVGRGAINIWDWAWLCTKYTNQSRQYSTNQQNWSSTFS